LRAIWGVHPIDETSLFCRISPIVEPKAKQQKKTDAMNAKNKSYESKYATRNGAAVKTISLQVAVTRPDLQNVVRKAFDLAKSGGRELNLAFTLQPHTQSFPKTANIRAAHLASF
jgi:hypothetical protein